MRITESTHNYNTRWYIELLAPYIKSENRDKRLKAFDRGRAIWIDHENEAMSVAALQIAVGGVSNRSGKD